MRKIISSIQVLISTLFLVFASQPLSAAEEISYFHTDALGSIVAKTDANGNLIWRQRYHPYGDTIDSVQSNHAIPEYTGKPHYDDLSLSYYGSRWYDRELGRFAGIDPVGWTEENSLHSLGRYTYVNNNPYKYVDPDGEFFWVPFLLAAGYAALTTYNAMEAYDSNASVMDDTYGGYSTNGLKAAGTSVAVDTALAAAGAGGGMLAAKMMGATVTKGADITAETIKQVLKNDPIMASQKAVDLKLVQKYFDDLANSKAPNIQMDGNVITNGHHRYIAGKIKGQMPGVNGGVLTNAKKANVRPIFEIEIY